MPIVIYLYESENNISNNNWKSCFALPIMSPKVNLSFLKYKSTCELQHLNCLDLGNNYVTSIACGRFVTDGRWFRGCEDTHSYYADNKFISKEEATAP